MELKLCVSHGVRGESFRENELAQVGDQSKNDFFPQVQPDHPGRDTLAHLPRVGPAQLRDPAVNADPVAAICAVAASTRFIVRSDASCDRATAVFASRDA